MAKKLNNMHEKLMKMREAVKRTDFYSFEELMAVVDKKAKYHRVLPLYCFYEKVATLTLVNLDDIADTVKFQIPAELVSLRQTKEYLYKMAFDLQETKESITPREYLLLLERMKALNVEEKDILERYKLKSLADVTPDVYKSCMRVFDKMTKKEA